MSEPFSPASETPSTSDIIKDGNASNFMSDVVQASMEVPVIVDFWAPGCAPCAQLTPQLEKAVKKENGKVKLVKINLAENPEIAAQFQVQSVPTVYALKNGQPVDGFAGALPESELQKFIQKLTGENDKIAEQLKAAETLLKEGEVQQAVDSYAAILRDLPQSPEALGGLIKCYATAGEFEAARETLDMFEDDLLEHEAIKSAVKALEIAEKGDNAGDLADLEAEVVKNPQNFEKLFELAIAASANNKNDIAINSLFSILENNMAWNEGAAKTQLLEFFEAWGPKDPQTIEGRKRLSSLLF